MLKGINHLAFITSDLIGTTRFYRDLLGMTLHAGVGHEGYRHYFFKLGDSPTTVAFFEYDGAREMKRKFPGVKTSEPLGFDHVSFIVESKQALFALKDRLSAAGFEVHGAVDHGLFWSIYFYDPNNIPLEASWQFMEIIEEPAITDSVPLAIADEGASAQPGHWPEVTEVTPASQMTASGGNALKMREDLLKRGLVRYLPGVEPMD